eukprot:scaffold135908_cov35-Prasinocladus_malaysianus.AAC.1
MSHSGVGNRPVIAEETTPTSDLRGSTPLRAGKQSTLNMDPGRITARTFNKTLDFIQNFKA